MTIKLFIYNDDTIEWEEQHVYNSAEFDERLDEQLDTGKIQVINNTSETFNDFCRVKVVLDNSKTFYFYGIDTVEKRGAGYYVHYLELVEPTRRLMGVFINGKKITQPLSGTKKTLKDVCDLLCKCIDLLGAQEDIVPANTPYWGIAENDLLKNTISPEFHWNAGTSLWECLCDIGNVIDCMPRVTIDENGEFSRIVFEEINATTGEYEI